MCQVVELGTQCDPWGLLECWGRRAGLWFCQPSPSTSCPSSLGFSWAAWHSVWPGHRPAQPVCLPLPASFSWNLRQNWVTARLSLFHHHFFSSLSRLPVCSLLIIRGFFYIYISISLTFPFGHVHCLNILIFFFLIKVNAASHSSSPFFPHHDCIF